VAVIALSWRWARVEPLPRTLAPGTTLRVRGTLLPGYASPELLVTSPTGAPLPVTTSPAQGEAFAFSAGLRDPGTYRVELLAVGHLGATVVANFPVDVGITPRTSVTVARRGAPADEGTAVQALFDAIARDRARAGLPALRSHATLAQVARAHSADMQAHGFVGHTSPTTGTAADRVARAGLRVRGVLENIGQGYSPMEVHDGLMQSPGHRANILHPDATHVGIGVLTRPEGSGALYVVTELFVRLTPRIDVDEGREHLLDGIDAARGRMRLPALARDDALAKACAAAAREFFASSVSREELSTRLGHAARALRRPYARLRVIVLVTDALDAAEAHEVFLDAGARAIGLAIAQGTRADTTPGTLVITAVLGYAP
jgi:uncharacterized protein YkwD